jgi:pimeloyl-ACP methyl ester carboxylesterase
MSLFLLVHSPSVGPSTWQPVASQLRDAGHEAVVTSLLAVGDGEPPFWPKVPAAVRDGVAGLDTAQPVVLVVHSNAGLFAPVIAHELRRPVSCLIFADASIPPAAGEAEVAESEFVPFLRELAGDDGRLPQWTSWWSDADVAPMLPDPRLRLVITAEQPRLPLAYYLERIPVPAGWDERPCGYLLFSDAYEGQADQARSRGWPVRTMPGQHLHQVVDPAGVTEALLELAGQSA